MILDTGTMRKIYICMYLSLASVFKVLFFSALLILDIHIEIESQHRHISPSMIWHYSQEISLTFSNWHRAALSFN